MMTTVVGKQPIRLQRGNIDMHKFLFPTFEALEMVECIVTKRNWHRKINFENDYGSDPFFYT